MQVAAFTAMFLVGRGALGADEPTSGPWAALRAGWALPVGAIREGDPLSGTYDRMIPLGLELGYHFGAHVYLGAYAEYGFVSVVAPLCPGLDCSAYDLRLGATAAFRIMAIPIRGNGPDSVRLVPWLGLGVGYEGTHTTVARGGQRSSRTDQGFFVEPQLGIDVMVLRWLGVGPFVAMPIGEYSAASVENPTETTTRAIANRKPHFWPMFGLRMFYDF